jgi:putative ABC transport system permease protein
MQNSLLVGVEALRANPLRTILSTLGVVMGVGAMVSVLSLGDGVERYARERLVSRDLLTISVSPSTSLRVDGQFVRKEDYVQLGEADAVEILAAVPELERAALAAQGPALVFLGDSAEPRGFLIRGVDADITLQDSLTVAHGRWVAVTDTAVVVLSSRAAGVVAGDTINPAGALGRTVNFRGNAHEVIGVLAPAEREELLGAYVPISDVSRSLGERTVLSIQLTARQIEDVDSAFVHTQRWAEERFGEKWNQEVNVVSRAGLVEQVATGMRVFKMLMAAITGVSLLVGGVGIMNVLLASVAERTREIGIRKAMGARDRDILVQFLAESVAITSFGASIGVLLGLAIAFGVAAIMRMQTKAEVFAAVTVPTVSFAVVVSVLIGLVFGLYPARRAARLSPIDAIRHE